jgi:UPF0755 protein
MKRFFRTFFLLLLLAAIAIGAAVLDAHKLLNEPLSLREVQRVSIARGERLQALAETMQGQGIFTTQRQGIYLQIWARLYGQHRQIKAGDFDLAPGTTPLQALEMFVEGRSVLSELRLPEGWKFKEAMALIETHPDLTHTLPVGVQEAQLMQAIGMAGKPAEGHFFPDTYRFTKGMRDVDFLRHAYGLMQTTLAAEWTARSADSAYASPEDALTMASIVEKETGAAFERPRIAGVFLRRLKIGMKLQTDPTVIYGMGDAFDGNLRRVDLERDGPYNSYTRAGLPPTPICLPGRAAIHAALHPEDDGSIYFVAKGNGTHQFSKTLDEHNAAVSRYQLGGQ